MSGLAAYQREFMRALFDDSAAPPGLEVHRANVAAGHHAALAAAYPVVERLVGEAFFREAARRYSREQGSASGDLHAFGAAFAAFLEACEPAAGLPWLADVARLEWAMHESFHAPDAPGLDFERLARIDPGRYPGLRLRLHPSVRLLASPHPVLAIWEANQPGRDGTPARTRGAERVLVRRVDLRAGAIALEAAEWQLLRRLAAGETIERAARAFRDAAALGPALARHALDGVFADFETDDHALG